MTFEGAGVQIEQAGKNPSGESEDVAIVERMFDRWGLQTSTAAAGTEELRASQTETQDSNETGNDAASSRWY